MLQRSNSKTNQLITTELKQNFSQVTNKYFLSVRLSILTGIRTKICPNHLNSYRQSIVKDDGTIISSLKRSRKHLVTSLSLQKSRINQDDVLLQYLKWINEYCLWVRKHIHGLLPDQLAFTLQSLSQRRNAENC